jgi:hypothetical protein
MSFSRNRDHGRFRAVTNTDRAEIAQLICPTTGVQVNARSVISMSAFSMRVRLMPILQIDILLWGSLFLFRIALPRLVGLLAGRQVGLLPGIVLRCFPRIILRAVFGHAPASFWRGVEFNALVGFAGGSDIAAAAQSDVQNERMAADGVPAVLAAQER